MSGPGWFESVWQDVRQAGRSLAHSRCFSIWVIGSLAVGMTVTLAALAFQNTLLFRPFPAVTAEERLAAYQKVLTELPNLQYDPDKDDRNDYQHYVDRAMAQVAVIDQK